MGYMGSNPANGPFIVFHLCWVTSPPYVCYSDRHKCITLVNIVTITSWNHTQNWSGHDCLPSVSVSHVRIGRISQYFATWEVFQFCVISVQCALRASKTEASFASFSLSLCRDYWAQLWPWHAHSPSNEANEDATKPWPWTQQCISLSS